MNESIISFADVEDGILNYEVTDETVEAAAGIFEGRSNGSPSKGNVINRRSQVRKTVSECASSPFAARVELSGQ